ncbi:hypothetical protein X975_07103, partial [Stegodyphus mimosarum]
MKVLIVLAFCSFLAAQSSFAEECEYTMAKMCSLTPGATYNERGCWYTCRIKAEFEVFSGTRINGSPCKSIIGGVDGVCKHGLCFPNE